MSKCIICGTECTGKTCSGACRAKLSRRTDKAHGEQAHAHAHAEPKGTEAIPNYGQSDCQCRHCRALKSNGLDKQGYTLNHGPYKPAKDLKDKELNRVSLPGDPDYGGVALKVA
jgi:hypothetical protein